MIEPKIDINNNDFVLTSDGDLKMAENEDTFLQDFVGDFKTEKGNDIFDDLYGVPWTDIAQFGRIQATDMLIESYLLDKAENLEIIDFTVIERTPNYIFMIKYKTDKGEQTLLVPVNQ